MSHPLIELANDRAVRQAAEFPRAAEGIDRDRLAQLYAAERAAAPSVPDAGRTYFVKRSGKAPTERKKNRDEEHLGSALIRSEPEIGYPLPDDGGYLKLFDYQVRAKVGPADDPETKGISRFDLLGVGPEDRLAVILQRYLEPGATRCRVGDTPLRLLLQGLTYHAIATQNLEALRAEVAEKFGQTLSDQPPHLMILASPRYWELCRKRSTQKGAAWIRELERIASDALEAVEVPVHFLSLRLEADPGWTYAEEGPVIEGRARLGLAWEPGAGRVKPKARPRPRARSESVDEVVEPDLSRPIRHYDLHDSYSAGDRIAHPKLGTGVVQGLAGPGKIKVRFDERQSVLVHERSV